MKKYYWFGLGLLIALPLSALASIVLPSFPDVAQDAWYANSVNQATLQGWMTGYENGNFGPQNPVLRSELATILSRSSRNLRWYPSSRCRS